GAAEGIEEPVLLGHLPAEGEGLEVRLDLRAMRGAEPRPVELAPQFVDLAGGARAPEPRQLLLGELALPPAVPELERRPGRAVARLGDRQRQEQLGVVVEARDL